MQSQIYICLFLEISRILPNKFVIGYKWMDPVLTSVNFGLFLTISTQLEYTETFGCPRSDISIKFGHNISTNYFSTNHLAAAGNESFLTGVQCL